MAQALETNVFSGKEFKVYIAQDATNGVHNGVGGNYYRLDVEGATMPTFSPNQEFELRSGSGKIAEFGQIFSSSKRVVNEFSLSGRCNLQDLPFFMQNATGVAAGTGTTQNLITIGNGFSGSTVEQGATAGWNNSVSIAFVAPTAVADSYIIPGCVCTSLTLSADMGTASGRFNYDATFSSSFAPLKGDTDAAITEIAAGATELTTTLGSTYIFLSDLVYRSMHIESGSFTNVTEILPLINNLSLTIENPAVALGAQGTNAEPELIARAVPEFTVTLAAGVKYDAETEMLLEAFRDPGNDSNIQFYAMQGDPAGTNPSTFPDDLDFKTANESDGTGGDANTLGMILPMMKLTSAEVSSDDVAMVNFEAKLLDDGSTGSNVENTYCAKFSVGDTDDDS